MSHGHKHGRVTCGQLLFSTYFFKAFWNKSLMITMITCMHPTKSRLVGIPSMLQISGPCKHVTCDTQLLAQLCFASGASSCSQKSVQAVHTGTCKARAFRSCQRKASAKLFEMACVASHARIVFSSWCLTLCPRACYCWAGPQLLLSAATIPD